MPPDELYLGDYVEVFQTEMCGYVVDRSEDKYLVRVHALDVQWHTRKQLVFIRRPPRKVWAKPTVGLIMSAEARQVGGDHYKRLTMQPMKFCMVNDWDCDAFQILRYLSRHHNKDGKKDIEKAIHCVELRAEQYEMHNRSCTALTDRISIEDYIEANGFDTNTAVALQYLEAWTYTGNGISHGALIRALRAILATYS
jgi:hypothetical protein